jgi:hypothetical protein
MIEHENGHQDWTSTDEARLSSLLGSLEEDVRAPAGFHSSVMRAVEEVPASPLRRLVDWWLRPRAVRVSPAMGALAVAASAALFLLWPAEAPDTAGQVVTRFVLVAPEAGSVHLTGDFLSWSREGIELEDLRGTGVWTADVPLPPGVYQYTFVIDGTRWVPDPTALSQVDDGFGQLNSVVIVPEGQA